MADQKPWEEFGSADMAPTEQKPWEAFGGETKPEPKGFLGHARDLGLSAVKSAIAVPELIVGLADIPTGGRVGKFLENEGGSFGFRPKEAKEILSDLHTDQFKAQQRQFQEADGVLDKTSVALENPSLIANTVVESVAPMLAGGVAARGVMGATKLGQMGAKGAAAAGAIGEGTMMAGSQAEAIRQETDDGLLTPTQAGAAVATGALGTLFGYLGGRVAQRFGLGDVDTMIAQGAKPQIVAGEIAKLPAKSIPRQVVEGAISEGFLEELPQSISEQIIQNLALDKPWSEGVEDAAVMGTLAGMAMGGGASLYSGMTRPAQQADEAPPAAGNEPPASPQGFTPTAERPVIDESALGRAGVFPPAPAPIINERALETVTPSQQMGIDPAAGPMSAAAALAVDTGASAAMQQAAQAVDPETGEILQAGAEVAEQKQAIDTPEQMRERLGFIEQQARTNGGWDRRLVEERDRLQAELTKVEPVADQDPIKNESLAAAGVEPAAQASDQNQTAADETPSAEQFDVSGRTSEQLQYLSASGQPGWKEAATAEIQRRDAQQPAATPALSDETVQPVLVEQPTPAVAQQAEASAPTATPVADDLRRQLQEVESKILAAAPDAIGAGGGDIETAMKSRKVPVTLKAQRKRIKEQLQQASVASAQGARTVNAPERVEVVAQAQETSGQEGEKTFAPETGTLGIPRAEMPQVPSKSRGGLVKHLNAQGIAHETTSVDAASLKPTQAEYSPEKVEASKTAAGDRAVIVSSDGHIVDGHHQALAAAEQGKQVKAIVLDAPIDQALEAVKNSPSAQAATPATSPRSESAQPGAEQPEALEFTTLKDRNGNTVTVRTADLSSARERMPTFTKDGKRKATHIHRDNLDPTGEKQAEGAKEIAANPLFNVITAKDGKAFSVKAAATRKLNALGLAETHEVVPAGDVQAGMKGYVVRKKVDVSRSADAAQGQSAALPDFSVIYNDENGVLWGIPYAMRQGQQPKDIKPEFRGDWVRLSGAKWSGNRDLMPAEQQAMSERLQPGEWVDVAQTAAAETEGDAQTAEGGNGATGDQDARQPEAFVSAPDGSIDFGEITPEMALAMRRQAGKIRLQNGVQNADGTGWGLSHIEANHGDQIRNAGFESVQHFVSHVARNFNEVLQAKNRQLLVAIDGGRQDVMFVQLEPEEGGDFYRINTAFPASRNYLEKQQKKGMKLLWGGSEPAPAAAGQQPPYAGAPAEESGQGAPIARGQSSDASVAPASQKAKNEGRAVAVGGTGNATVDQSSAQKAESTQPAAKIEDFGEKIGGARKDVWSGFKDDLNAVSDEDIASQPLSKIWPAPDYDQMIEGGKPAEVVATIRALRDEIPTKPRQTWKVLRWADQVKTLREFANYIIDGKVTLGEMRKAASENRALEQVFGRIDLYMAVGHAKSLQGVRLSFHHYSLYKGQKNVSMWSVEQDAKATAWSNWPRELATGKTKEEAIAAFKSRYEALDINAPASKQTTFEIYSQRGAKGYWVGKKIGRNPILLEGPFDDIKAARAYKDANNDKLVEKLEKAKAIPSERRDTNEPRVGVDMRNGQDVTPELFAETFGFRGVEFGNWVEGSKRQKDLNEAFDALMDMAAILNVPPKALSLNGELGLAFGARGKGGIRPAKAHYEPGYVVINMTKKDGAGSLGHEWWHALDNYFSRMRGKGGDMMTEALDVSLASRGSEFVEDAKVRKQMIEAFGNVMKAINRTALRARSAKLDERRAKAYWTTGPEMSARAFESFLISKLQDQNASNDYLANIVDEKTWKAAEALGFELDGSYPYPTAGEVPAIRAAFDEFFATVQTRETEKGVALFSFAGRNALTADRHALASAQRRIAVGEDAEAVRQDTGWHRGADGRWRFEISDDQARLKVGGESAAEVLAMARMEAMADGRDGVTLGDVLDHPALFAAYPHLSDMPVELLPAGETATARLTGRKGAMRMQLNGQRLRRNGIVSAAMHELQHAIQFAEGFATGGSKQKLVSALDSDGAETYRRLAGEVEARNTQTRLRMTAEQRRTISPELTADVPTDEVIVTFNGRAVDNAATPKNLGSRLPVTERGLLRALDLQFKGLVKPVRAMLARGRAGKRGGLVMIDSADPLRIAHAFASRTGRALDGAIELFSEAGSINGFYDPKSGLTFLVGPNLDPVTAPAVLLHEMIHGQQRAKIDARAMDMLRSRGSVKDPALRGFLDRVAERMLDAGAASDSKEAAAYIVEQAVIEGRSQGFTMADNRFLGWVDSTLGQRIGDLLRSMIAAVRGWMMRNGLGVQSLTVDDLVGYAMAGLDRAAGGAVEVSEQNAAASVSDAEVRALVAQYAGVQGAPTDAQLREAVRQYRETEAAYGGRESYERARADGQTKLNYRQWVLVRTPAFKAWFGDWENARVSDGLRSANGAATAAGQRAAGDPGVQDAGRVGDVHDLVLDPDTNEPRVFFHGTRGDIAAFDLNHRNRKDAGWLGRGVYVTSDDFLAESYSNVKAGEAGRNVMPLFVRASSPYLATLKDKQDASRYSQAQIDTVTERMKAAGHDGAALVFGDGTVELVVFDPAQVKSAIGNIGTFDGENPDIRFSRSGARSPQQIAKHIGDGLKSITVQDVKLAGRHKLTDWLKLGLQFLGRRQLVDIYGDVLPLAEYDRLAAQMEADKNDVGASADDLARRWGKLPDESKLADLMHDATLAQIDADDTVEYAPGDDLVKSRMLKAQFAQLSPEAQKVYREARDHYRKHHAEVRQAITDRIMRSELREERRAELLKRMDDDFFKSIKGVYFPLARFGQYVVVTKDDTGKVASVSRAETMAEAEAMRQEMVKAFPAKDGYQVGRVILSKEFIAGRDMVGRGFMSELFNALDEQQLDPRVMAELEDTLGQLYLSSLPDLSWAKHGIHRKGTPGFSQDARRAFAQNTFHGARYLAKLRYGDQMQAELDRMQKHVDEMSAIEDFDQPGAQRVVDEMNKRHEAMMNPKSNPLSTALTSFGFVYYLGISPAAAMVNLSQTPLVAYPVMGAKWGFRKAGAALMTASRQTMEGKNDLRSRLKNEDEIAAYDEAVRTGVIDVTMAHDLAGIAQGEDAKVMWKIRPVMRAASFLFHHAERFNRQATFLAAYRLARDAGSKHDTAYAQAVKATYDGHFDYSASNRPRVMQGNVAKVVLLFKQYAQNMIYTIARNAYQSVKGESPEVRREARKVFASLMTMHAAAAGVLGLPMVGTLLALASALGGSDDEPWDAEVALRNMLADAFGPKTSEVIARGFSRLTPWDVSGRVGLDKLLLPDVNESLEGQRWAEAFATAMLGPVIGMGVNAAKGAQKMSDGDYARGLEDMLPIFARNPIKAYRQYSEGEVDRTGVVIKDEVSLAGVLGQASGFSPSEIRLAFEGRSAVMSADRRLNERRQDLMTQFARAATEQDQDGMVEARSAIAEFNKVNPGRRITPPQLWQSVRNRQRRIREADDGVYLPRARRDALEAGRFAEVG